MRSPLRSWIRSPVSAWVAAALGSAAAAGPSILAAQAAGPAIQFQDVAADAGLHFVLENSPTAEKHMIEAVPGGVAAFDADSDGMPDIYFANGAEIPSLRKADPRYSNRLFRNLGGMRFKDITAEAGVAGRGYSMGIATADYDNDGDVDLFVAGVRANILFRNAGDGTFEDVTARTGISSEAWSVAAGWFDYDNDGALDLLVVNYLDWNLSMDRYCGDRDRALRIYCSPTYFSGLPNALYRNRGDGTFENVSAASGIASHVGKGMSVAFADYDLDGWVDAFVTNDTEADFLIRNRGDGTFEETGLLAGVGLASDGNPISSMGADFRDYDNDGLPDIHVTALPRQTFPLFRNIGDGQFEDMTARSGLHGATVTRGGWANALVDLDNDGFKDLFVATSHVNDQAERFESAAYEQRNAVFRNDGRGGFEDLSEGVADFEPAAHRGAAFADFDDDGRVDVVVSVLGGPAELWQNVTANRNRWVKVQLKGTQSNRDGIGAVVRVGNQVSTASPAVGYASSSHVPVHFGLSEGTDLGEVQVAWPSGIKQSVSLDETNRTVVVEEPSRQVR